MELTVILEFDSVEDAIAADESPSYQEALSPLPTARSRGFASLRPVLKRSKPGRARHPQHRWDRRRACAPTARQGCECSYARPRSKQAGGRPGGSVLVVAFAPLAASRPLFSCPLRACSDPYASVGGPVW